MHPSRLGVYFLLSIAGKPMNLSIAEPEGRKWQSKSFRAEQ
jgi:hypothetical protein